MSSSPNAATAPAREFETLLRLRDVIDMTKLGSSTIYRKMDTGGFPRPLNLGGNVVRWRMSDVQGWIRGLPIHQPDQH